LGTRTLDVFVTNQTIQVKPWWPENVREWFEKEFSKTDLDDIHRPRLERLATDERMKDVAKKLSQEEKRSEVNPGSSLIFIKSASKGPDLWKAHKNDPIIDRDAELDDFAGRCRDFAIELEKERAM
jgi:hypothetical protein